MDRATCYGEDELESIVEYIGEIEEIVGDRPLRLRCLSTKQDEDEGGRNPKTRPLMSDT